MNGKIGILDMVQHLMEQHNSKMVPSFRQLTLQLTSLNVTFAGRRPHLYFITAKHLHSLDVANGVISECIALPDQYRYTQLYIDHETCLLAVSSVKNKASSDIVMAFALYNYNPIQLLQLLEASVFIVHVDSCNNLLLN